MEPLFAPWRLAVIESYEKQTTCVFCEISIQSPSVQNLVIHQGRSSFVVMNKFPYSNGHLLILPKRHCGKWEDLNEDELLEIMQLSQRSMAVLRKVVNCEGFNMGANLGRVAGAGIPDHAHIHIVPRWNGDTNFMPVLAETKMISEHIEATYKKIADEWGKG